MNKPFPTIGFVIENLEKIYSIIEGYTFTVRFSNELRVNCGISRVHDEIFTLDDLPEGVALGNTLIEDIIQAALDEVQRRQIEKAGS